ncbi:MAG: hypothetical protein LBQ00_01270 [Syntrophobacterales bacterium]|jgi:cysteine sulfinate desulfinase/cysteine desulfurase-like protein|nr:hypothetical protein [Syntrophobacterales bacterium]
MDAKKVVVLVGVEKDEIIFTAPAMESNNASGQRAGELAITHNHNESKILFSAIECYPNSQPSGFSQEFEI